ncbi:MAG: DUF3237 domain-containing protein [Hyphomicrobiales bacterium]|nr:DUF3237 domain-containing protein [Hyphomicrobiales bacterium]
MIGPATLSRLRFGDSIVAAEQAALCASKHLASDGSALWWGGIDTPGPPQIVAPGAQAPVLAAVSPMRPGHSVTVEYRVDGGPVREAMGVIEPRVHDADARIFRAVLPGQSSGLVEFLPVLRFAGQPISTRLLESEQASRYQVGGGATPVATLDSPPQTTARSHDGGRWLWDAKFLGGTTIKLRKEVVGVVSDGFRIIWRFDEAPVVGPLLEGRFLPGAADWMRIRPDGVAIVQVEGCIETRSGARVYTTYGGYLELGRDGYARALRGEFDPWPPFVCAPTYATADKALEWLNRAQCLIVGRVDMKALTVESDAYLIEVGGRKNLPERGGARR